jgi:hypothetical protein
MNKNVPILNIFCMYRGCGGLVAQLAKARLGERNAAVPSSIPASSKVS